MNDNNVRSQSLIRLEENCATHQWLNMVFAFTLGVSEVNTKLTEAYFTNLPQPIMLDFRKLQAKERMNDTNHYQKKFDSTMLVKSISDYPQFK